MDEKYIVYIKVDSSNCIIDCNSSAFLTDTTGWIAIDEGNGDKYHHAQGHYFNPPFYTDDGFPQWKYDGVQCVLQPEAIIEIQRKEAAKAAYKVNRNITAGELVTINGQMYKAISNIPNGGYIIEGQNAVKTTIEAELLILQQQKGE